MELSTSYLDDVAGQLIEPEILTPEQHRDQVSRERIDQPEVRLMLAVMEDAVATYQRFLNDPERGNKKQFEEVRSWIRSADTSWPYSFENICEALQFESELVRGGLLAWETKPAARKAAVYRFPFRRVNGKRHSISIRDRHAEAV